MAKRQLDCTDMTEGDLEDKGLPVGWYAVKCVAYEVDDNFRDCFTFVVTSTFCKGKRQVSFLNNPDHCSVDSERAGQIKKMRLWFHRLGILSKEDVGKSPIIDPTKPVGKDFVLEIEAPTFNKKTGEMGKFPQIAYGGVYPLDHESIPVAVRQQLGLPQLPGQVTTDAAGKAAGARRKSTEIDATSQVGGETDAEKRARLAKEI